DLLPPRAAERADGDADGRRALVCGADRRHRRGREHLRPARPRHLARQRRAGEGVRRRAGDRARARDRRRRDQRDRRRDPRPAGPALAGEVRVSKAFAFFLRPFRHPITRAFMSAPSGVFALVVLAILAFAAAFGPAIYGDEAETQDFSSVNLKPSWDHWL